ncbi:hypothetical protein GGQ76_002369 [Aureimonas jatrophae]|nr:hypothetical protein [Aureimonas jatrophae]
MIVGRIGGIDGTTRRDVGRKREDADDCDRCVEVGTGPVEAKLDFARLSLRTDMGHELSVAELDGLADGQLLRGTDEGLPNVGSRAHVKCDIDLRDRITPPARSVQLGWNDARIVENDHIVGPQQIRQVPNMPVGKRTA